MRIVHLAAGAGAMYCGACVRDARRVSCQGRTSLRFCMG